MKLVLADYNPNTGISRVRIANKYGTYEGIAKTHPEENHKSNLAGCYIAELRAWLKFYKKQLPKKKVVLKTLKNLKRDILDNCYENKDIMKRVNLAIRNTDNEIKEIKESIKVIEENIVNYIKSRDELLKKK